MVLKDYLFNPVKFLPDRVQTGMSLFFVAGAILINYCGKTIQDGIYHTGFLSDSAPGLLVVSTLLVFLLPSALLFIAGKTFNKGTRFIDLWNSFVFSMVPLLLVNILSASLLNEAAATQLAVATNAGVPDDAGLLVRIAILGVIGLPCFIYSIVLLVNGYKTATNAKKTPHYIWMGLAIIAAEIIYRLFLYPSLINYFTK